jgi:hypothetical protein
LDNSAVSSIEAYSTPAYTPGGALTFLRTTAGIEQP